MSSFFLSLSLSFPFFLGFSSYPVFPLGIFFVMCSVLKRADRNSFYSPPISTLYFFFSSLIPLKLNCYNPLFFYLIGQSLERNAEDISILMGRGVEMSRSESVQDSINTLQNYIDQYGQYRWVRILCLSTMHQRASKESSLDFVFKSIQPTAKLIFFYLHFLKVLRGYWHRWPGIIDHALLCLRPFMRLLRQTTGWPLRRRLWNPCHWRILFDGVIIYFFSFFYT